MNLQLPFTLYTLSFSYIFFNKKMTKSGRPFMRFKLNTIAFVYIDYYCPTSHISQKPNVLLCL